jgi:hypothetical protein
LMLRGQFPIEVREGGLTCGRNKQNIYLTFRALHSGTGSITQPPTHSMSMTGSLNCLFSLQGMYIILRVDFLPFLTDDLIVFA